MLEEAQQSAMVAQVAMRKKRVMKSLSLIGVADLSCHRLVSHTDSAGNTPGIIRSRKTARAR